MGFAITWCAVPQSVANDFFEKTGLVPTGLTEEIPESAVSIAHLDTGWSILWVNDFDCSFLKEAQRQKYSENHDLIVCQVEEHAMTSIAERWSKGACQWRIAHEGIDGPSGLETSGALPVDFSTIKVEMEDAQKTAGGDQADVDYIFEIPLLVAKSIVGFKHDEDCAHLIDNTFQVMERPHRKGGFWSRLLGK
ncbi:MAG: hypothetical protein AAFX93_15985 [Verrucomicrobiota bacterium]